MSTIDTGPLQRSIGYRLMWDQADWHDLREKAEHIFGALCVSRISPGELGDDELVSISKTLLSSAFSLPSCSALEYRYVLTPGRSGSPQAALYLTVKSYSDYGNEDTVRAALNAVRGIFPAQFELDFCPRQDVTDAPTRGMPILELRRSETCVEPVYDYVPADFFYIVHHNLGDGSGWRNFWDTLPTLNGPVEISFLFKQTNLTFEERSECSSIISDLYRMSESRTEPNPLGYDTYYPADTNARMAYESWDSLLRKLQSCLLARIAIRGELQRTIPLATRLCSALHHSENGASTDPALIVVQPDPGSQYQSAVESFDWLEIYPWGGHWIWHPDSPGLAPYSLRRFPYLYSLDDASSIAMLPVPDDRGSPGFLTGRRSHKRRQTILDREPANDLTASENIRLGNFLDYGIASEVASMSLSDLNRHTLIVGSSGSGKTTTVLTILARLWREHKIPFLVIEPTKREYRSLLTVDGMDEMHVLPIGREDICAFRLNPLAPPEGIQLENHMSSLMAMFKLALPLFDPLPQLLEEALEHAFFAAGWSYDGAPSTDRVPSLRDLTRSFDVVFKKKEYVSHAENIGTAMQLRLNSMLRGSRGRILDTVKSNDFKELLKKPVVIELDSIEDADDKSLFAAIFLDRIRSGCKDRESGGRVNHVTVIEEAHRVLPKVSMGSNDVDSVRRNAVEAYCNAIAELRSMGEGFIISSQSPNRLAPAAIANAGSRILHRMESAEDRATILADFDLNDLDRPLASRLDVGEAFFRSVTMDDAELIKVYPEMGIDSSNSPKDDIVKNRMRSFSEASQKLFPYPMCTSDVCATGCVPATRREGESVASRVRITATQAWNRSEDASAEEAIDATAKVLLRETDDSVVAYCGSAHLNVQQRAFLTGNLVSLRSNVAARMRLSPHQ